MVGYTAPVKGGRMSDPTREEVTGYRQFQAGWIHEKARLGEGVELAPGAVVGPSVTVGDRCRIGENAVLKGPAVLGSENVSMPARSSAARRRISAIAMSRPSSRSATGIPSTRG